MSYVFVGSWRGLIEPNGVVLREGFKIQTALPNSNPRYSTTVFTNRYFLCARRGGVVAKPPLFQEDRRTMSPCLKGNLNGRAGSRAEINRHLPGRRRDINKNGDGDALVSRPVFPRRVSIWITNVFFVMAYWKNCGRWNAPSAELSTSTPLQRSLSATLEMIVVREDFFVVPACVIPPFARRRWHSPGVGSPESLASEQERPTAPRQ